MENDKQELLDLLNGFDTNFSSKAIPSQFGHEDTITKIHNEDAAKEEYKQHLKDIQDFIASFNTCTVSPEITGEWNVIQKEISKYLSSVNVSYDGSCSRLIEFYSQELQHLNSIKNKLGNNSIENQMICSLVAETIILDIESSMIFFRINNPIPSNNYTNKLEQQNMLKDSLNVLTKVATLNMEYQYKYEKFTPFYNSLSEKAKLYGIVPDETKIKNNKTGCLSVITIAIVSTTLLLLLI